jgi:hypothetical protein
MVLVPLRKGLRPSVGWARSPAERQAVKSGSVGGGDGWRAWVSAAQRSLAIRFVQGSSLRSQSQVRVSSSPPASTCSSDFPLFKNSLVYLFLAPFPLYLCQR